MYKGSIRVLWMGVILFLSVAVSAQDKIGQDKVGKKLEDEAEQSVKSAKVLREIMATPDKEIPEDLLARAECVAVFPSVIKAGFIVGGAGAEWRAVALQRAGARLPISILAVAVSVCKSARNPLTSFCCL